MGYARAVREQTYSTAAFRLRCGSSLVRKSTPRLSRLARWAGRLLILGAVLFWWGGVVVPNLVSLAFPAWLSPESIPRDLNPDIDWEGRLANRVSAAALLALAVLALVSAEVSRRRSDGWVAVMGWTVLAGTAAFLFWEETTDFHATELPGLARSVFSEDVLSQAGTFIWVLMAIPLIADSCW